MCVLPGGKVARNGETDPPKALHGGVEAEVFRDRSRRLGLPFAHHVRLGPGALTDVHAIHNGKAAKSAAGDLYIAPDEEAMPDVVHWLNAYKAARRRIFVSTPTAIRAALREAGAQRFLKDAMARVEAIDPSHSARRRITPLQATVVVALLLTVATGFILEPLATLVLVELLAAVFFVGVAGVRFVAAGLVPDRPAPPPERETVEEERPVYTVLVPLRHEAHMLPQLLAGLDRLDWPRDRLDVKLIIDEDDVVTLGAARTLARTTPYEIVIVPAGGPRTKPMALQYALSFALGEFVTVYDAEDRPHPGQIAEAYATFRQGPPSLACLQAPLVIDNPETSRLAGLFAVEYSTLFDGLLPALVKLRLPLPLGGTSNHFRRAALERAGGWDPWNVTEDADLGIRLTRFGYETATISLPTLEEAPVTLAPWMRQRARWFKGWLRPVKRPSSPLNFRELLDACSSSGQLIATLSQQEISTWPAVGERKMELRDLSDSPEDRMNTHKKMPV